MVRVLMTFRIYMITGYVLALILMGWILSKIVFPMIGRWIVDLCKKLEAANRRMEQEREAVLGQQVQKRKDDKCVIDGLYIDENDIEEAYRG